MDKHLAGLVEEASPVEKRASERLLESLMGAVPSIRLSAAEQKGASSAAEDTEQVGHSHRHRTGTGHQACEGCHRLEENIVACSECFFRFSARSGDFRHAIVFKMHDGVGMAGDALHGLLRLLGSAASFELKRSCYHCDHKRTVCTRQFGELRGCRATCSSTETRAKKNNIGTLYRLAEFAHGFAGGFKCHFGISTGSKAVGCHRAECYFSGCHRSVK